MRSPEEVLRDKLTDALDREAELRTQLRVVRMRLGYTRAQLERKPAPNWDEAPEWANYLTHDRLGWRWWSDCPVQYPDTGCWISPACQPMHS